ncbi:hypothetical protein HDU91_000750, partial [Kappamyces sp. JEL0680]
MDLISSQQIEGTRRQPSDVLVKPENGDLDQDLQESLDVDPVLAKEQLKWLSKTITNLKKRKDAALFLFPVNPVALGIPHYFDVIKQPMDISTIEKKIASGAYATVDAALADFDLMFNNCYTFNGPESHVSLSGKSLQSHLGKEVEKMPRTLAQVQQIKRPGRPSQGGAPLTGRPSLSREESGKRRAAAAKKSGTELKFCHHVLKEITKKAYQAFTWPFAVPVDPVALNIPSYFTIIKYPMDLSTIRKKLELAEYATSDEFEADFRLMLDNCYKFNGVGSEIANLGKQLEALFNQKWSEMHNFLAQHGEVRPKTSHYSDDDLEDENDSDAPHVAMIKSQLAMLNSQLAIIMEKRRKKRERKRQSIVSASSTAPASYYTAPSAPVYGAPAALPSSVPAKKPGKRGRKRKNYDGYSEDEKMPEGEITYEQKRELSDNINILPPEKLPLVFEIIKENAQLTGVEDEEIELDIDSLDKQVLWKLYLFVKKHTRPPKKAKYEDQGGENTMVGP